MFDLFKVFVKQLFQNPKHYNVRAGENPKPQLPQTHSNSLKQPTRTRTRTLSLSLLKQFWALLKIHYNIIQAHLGYVQAPFSDRAVIRGRNRLKDYLPVLEIIDMLAKQK